MKKISDKTLLLAVLGTAVLGLSVVVFLVRTPRTPAAWMGYLFFLLAAGVAAAIIAALGHGQPDAAFFAHTLPMRRFLLLYAGAEALLLVLFVFVIPGASWKLALAVETVCTVSFWCMGVVVAMALRRVLQQQEEDAAGREEIRAMARQIQGLADAANDPALKEKLQALGESFRFAMPASEKTRAQDAALQSAVADLSCLVRGGDVSRAMEAASGLSLGLARREREGKR